MGRECEDCRGATPAKPPFERRWRGAPEDRMPHRGITTAVPHRSKNHISAQQDSPLSQEAMRLRRILSPGLTATLFRKEGFQRSPPRDFYKNHRRKAIPLKSDV